MIYLYDNAIVKDLEKSFNPDNSTPVVKVVAPDNIIGLAAQVQEDQISFPIVALERIESISVDKGLTNFTRMHKGVAAVFDKKENNFYNEKALPLALSYTLTVLTTNQADMDEILRELLFKYTAMYFLKIQVPYESKREISFGVVIDSDSGIQKRSGLSEYTSTGQLYQSSIVLRCEGCVLLHYTPIHLRRTVPEVEVK